MQKLALLCLLALLILNGCRDDELDLAGDLLGVWISQKVIVSGTDISNISKYELMFAATGTVEQLLETHVGGQMTSATKSGTWQPSGQKIIITFAGEAANEWLVHGLSATDLQVEFSRNGEQFALDFLKK